MAGELQLGGSTVATHTGSGASAVVTIDNGVKFPAGHIIQTVSFNTVSGAVVGNVSSTTSATTVLSITVNNVLESSIIIGFVSTGSLLMNSGNNIFTKISGGGISTTHGFYNYGGLSNTNTRISKTFMFKDPAPATGTNTYLVQAYSDGSGNAAYWCDANQSHGYTILEIAQ